MASFKFILTIFMLFSLYIQTGLAEVASTPTSEVSPADESIQTPLPYANIDNSTAEESSVDNDDKASADAKDDDDLDVSSDPYDPYTIFEGDQRRRMCRGKCRRFGGQKLCHCTWGGHSQCKCHISHAPCRCIVR